MKPGRVLLTCDAVGGVWRWALDAAHALGENGIDTVLVAFGPEPTAAQREEARAVPGATLLWFDHPLDWLAGDESALAGIPGVLEGVAALYQVDLLHLNLPSQARGLERTRPVVVMSHSCMATWWEAVRGGPLPEDFALNARLVREGFARADRVLAPSRSHAAALERVYGRVPDLAVVHNATRPVPEPDTCAGEAVKAVAVGRWWDDAKNARTLDAAAALASTPLAAIGPTRGPGGQSVAFAHAATYGSLTSEETRTALARAAVFVSPARYEPFGLAALEAARSGCALVLADIPTFRELWDDAAVFVDPDDAAGFAEAIDAICRDARLHAWHAGRAAERAERYAPQAQAERLIAVYEEAMASAPADPLRLPPRLPIAAQLPDIVRESV